MAKRPAKNVHNIKGKAGKIPRPEVDSSEVEEAQADTGEKSSPLGIYLSLNKISISAFAKAAGVPFKSAKDWASGSVLPNLVAAYEIERITKGAVPMETWLGIARAKAQLATYRSFQPDEINKMPTEIRGAGMAIQEPARKKRAKEDAERIAEQEERSDTED